MDNKTMRKLSQLYVDDDLHTNVKGFAELKEQDIKTVVTNFIKQGFKSDLFFRFCQERYLQNAEERKQYKKDPIGFDLYCSTNLEWLKEEHHKSLLD